MRQGRRLACGAAGDKPLHALVDLPVGKLRQGVEIDSLTPKRSDKRGH